MSAERTTDAVLNELCQLIRARRIAVGERLPAERELAARLGCGRVVARQAVRQLEAEGVIRHLGGYRRVVARLPATGSRQGRLPEPDPAGALMVCGSLAITEGRLAPGWGDFIVDGAVRRLRAEGLRVQAIDPAQLDDAALDALAAAPPGMLLVPDPRPGLYVPGSDDWLQRLCGRQAGLGTAVAIFSGEWLCAQADHVLPDHAAGWAALVQYLVETGRRRILPVLPEVDLPWTRERMAGYRRACDEAGIDALPELRLVGDGALLRGRSRMHALARARLVAGNLVGCIAGIDALLAPSDAWVAACQEALRIHGRQDVAVAGYDAFWQEHWDCLLLGARPVATVDKRNAAIGARLAELALARRADPSLPYRTVLIEPRLVLSG